MSALAEYRAFIAAKAGTVTSHGFAPTDLADGMKHHQRVATEYALNKGRAALFLDTGLGKSYCELEFARQCAEETGKPSLILTP